MDLNSVLMTEAQRDAVEVHAFEAGHVEVLSSEDVFEHAEDILLAAENNAAEKAGKEAKQEKTCPCPEPSPTEESPESKPSPGPGVGAESKKGS